MVKLSEIIIDQTEKLWDGLRDGINSNAMPQIKKLQAITDNFRYAAHEVFSPEVIDELKDTFDSIYQDVKQYYTESQQTRQLTEYVIRYLNND